MYFKIPKNFVRLILQDDIPFVRLIKFQFFCAIPSGSPFPPNCVLYSFCTNLLQSLIMWLIVSSLSSHNLNFLFSCVSSIFALNPSSSSSRAASMDLLDPHSSPISIVHHFREVFQATSCISTELLYIGSSWSSYLCSSMWRDPLEYITHEFVLTSPAVSRMSGSSNFDNFRDEW